MPALGNQIAGMELDALPAASDTIDLITMLKRAVIYMVEMFLSLWSLPIEVFLHHGIGRRFYSLPALLISTYLPLFCHGVWMMIASLGRQARSLSPIGQIGGGQFGGGERRAFVPDDPYWLQTYLWAALALGLIHRLHVLRLATQNREPLTTFAGRNLPPLLTFTRYLLSFLPGNAARLAPELTHRLIEPLCVYLAASVITDQLSPLLGWWLKLAAIAWFLRSQIIFGGMRDRALDQYDSYVQARVMAEMLKRRQAGETLAERDGVFAYAVAPEINIELKGPHAESKTVAVAQPASLSSSQQTSPPPTVSEPDTPMVVGVTRTSGTTKPLSAADLIRQRREPSAR